MSAVSATPPRKAPETLPEPPEEATEVSPGFVLVLSPSSLPGWVWGSLETSLGCVCFLHGSALRAFSLGVFGPLRDEELPRGEFFVFSSFRQHRFACRVLFFGDCSTFPLSSE